MQRLRSGSSRNEHDHRPQETWRTEVSHLPQQREVGGSNAEIGEESRLDESSMPVWVFQFLFLFFFIETFCLSLARNFARAFLRQYFQSPPQANAHEDVAEKERVC
mmetsp:Transcript_27011/g.105048  ORF Transcript_27011/g.105048 Transcript_27011/m.105048 type:complete len:106 (+) Transcript_27011:696-1013(+)